MILVSPHLASPTLTSGSIAFLAALVAGAINSVAGGGTLISFPVLVWLGLPPVTANATNAAAIVPGSLGGIWGYRAELRTAPPRLVALAAPSLLGGAAGAWLLSSTSQAFFQTLVPYLILFATLLFMAQDWVQRKLSTNDPQAHASTQWLAGAMVFQFFVGLYGGYFGAGMGILMLAALSILGMTDIHRMNGLKNFFALCINGVASLYFVSAKMVDWPYVLVMAAGAMIGGYACAGLARRVGQKAVRRTVVVIGWAMAVSLFLKQ